MTYPYKVPSDSERDLPQRDLPQAPSDSGRDLPQAPFSVGELGLLHDLDLAIQDMEERAVRLRDLIEQ